MKHRRSILFAAVFVCFQAAALRAPADDLFRLSWQGTSYLQNSSGHIAAVTFTQQDLVQQVAQRTGMSPLQLVLVYRPRKRDVAVVRNNGAFVATVFQMGFSFVDVNNPNNSIVVRQATLSAPADATVSGSFLGLEQRTFASNGAFMTENLNGTVQYSTTDPNTVFSAHVLTGARVIDLTNAP
jgi:hypothetical protein